MYYRGKYTYRKPRFVDLSTVEGAKFLSSGWAVAQTASGIVVESNRQRQYLVELVPGSACSANLAKDFVEDVHDYNGLSDRFRVRILQKSSTPAVWRSVANRRIRQAAIQKIAAAVKELV